MPAFCMQFVYGIALYYSDVCIGLVRSGKGLHQGDSSDTGSWRECCIAAIALR